jgi:hypothetical protein
MSKFAEKLVILKDAGEALLNRISAIKRAVGGATKPAFIADPAYAKATAALLKKFPEFEPAVEKASTIYVHLFH